MAPSQCSTLIIFSQWQSSYWLLIYMIITALLRDNSRCKLGKTPICYLDVANVIIFYECACAFFRLQSRAEFDVFGTRRHKSPASSLELSYEPSEKAAVTFRIGSNLRQTAPHWWLNAHRSPFGNDGAKLDFHKSH